LPEETHTVDFPVADLGPLASLTRRELSLVRALARGLTVEDAAMSLHRPVREIIAVIEHAGYKLGWGDIRGVRTHAYASGLHLFTNEFFSRIVLSGIGSDED
jgi:DNA-binding NarL/FixJ family response regulator